MAGPEASPEAAPPELRPLWLIKLGGSLLAGREQGREGGPESWLDAILAAPGPARLIVPGGGPFADAIRALEQPLGLGPVACHRMAILAMQQYAIHLQERRPTLRLVASLGDIARLRDDAAVGVWLPWELVGLDPSIEASWAVTSDSLALHLALRVRATGLVLVKSATVPERPTTATALATAGLIDTAMPGLLAGSDLPVRLLGPGQARGLVSILAGEAAGCPVLAA